MMFEILKLVEFLEDKLYKIPLKPTLIQQYFSVDILWYFT